VAFNKEFVKKRQDESSAKRMWGIVAGMVHWLEDEFGAWLGTLRALFHPFDRLPSLLTLL
jgi:hypothetical protein